MIELVMSVLATLLVAGGVGALSVAHPPDMKRWLWFAFAEYLVCSLAQLVYSQVIVHGGDEMIYLESGSRFARLLDANFGFIAPELTALLLQRESVFDAIVYGGGGSNTGSMHAICGFMVFLFRGSEFGAHIFVSGLALFGTLAIYGAMTDAYPEVPRTRMFLATVMFPSTAFWTCAFHKECFGIVGIGLVLAGWRAVYRGRMLRALVYLPLGLEVVYLFRAPALGPVVLGLVAYFVLERVQRTRGAGAVLASPAYFLVGLVALAVAMLAMSRVAPSLGVDKLGESVAQKQSGWVGSAGGSTFAADVLPQSLSGQILRVPLALVNALLRPQLFDVHNFGALLSALEMTAILFVLVRAYRRQGFGGMLSSIQRSPFLTMCAIVTFVGCAFVGLVTLNFGSLARYRVPFLPFYGALLTGLVDLPALRRERSRGEGTMPAALRVALSRPRPVIPSRRRDDAR